MSDGTASRGVTIKIWLIDGTPQGMRLSEKSGWTGSCLDFARSDYGRARLRVEAGRTGLYVLVGPDPEFEVQRDRVYVGEGDMVRTRLDQHEREKDFWTRGFFFTSKDESLNKAHVRYLEARLVGLAFQAASAAVDNNTVPEARGLSEAERDDMEAFLDDVLLLLPLLGVEAFSPLLLPNAARPASHLPLNTGGGWNDPVAVPDAGGIALAAAPIAKPLTGAAEAADAESSGTAYYFRERGRGPGAVNVDAEGRDTPRGFIVLEGSTGPVRDKVMTRGYELLRQRLRADGTLVAGEPGSLRMSRNFPFDSPSAAASVLAGGSKNGKLVWKDVNGNTLATRRAAVASGDPATRL